METTVSIPGMHCDSCASLIKDISGDFSAIKNVDINLTTKLVALEHAENFDLAAWIKEVESLGEKYKVQKTE